MASAEMVEKNVNEMNVAENSKWEKSKLLKIVGRDNKASKKLAMEAAN